MSTDADFLILQKHARQRGAQRAVSEDQMRVVVQHGRRLHRAGVLHYFFGQREVAQSASILGSKAQRLHGIVVVVSYDGHILTTYRNKEALAHIKRKPKWRWPQAAA